MEHIYPIFDKMLARADKEKLLGLLDNALAGKAHLRGFRGL